MHDSGVAGDSHIADLGKAPNRAIPWIVLAIWLLGTGYAFWFLERNEQALSHAALFDSSANAVEAEQWLRTQLAQDNAAHKSIGVRATVVHLYRPACSCNESVQKHLDNIDADYRARGVRLLRASQELPRWVSATPAAMVFDATGKLTYFGPYADSAWCGSSTGLVERALDGLMAGHPSQPQRITTRGCFCGDESAADEDSR